MKIYFYILFFLISIPNYFAQNLVNNPGFETTSGCGGNGALAQATGWNCPPGGITLADLYTPCASTGVGCSNFNTLGSMAGCSNACEGSKYTGQIAYYTGCPNCREYLHSQLSSPLVAGTTYFLSFKTKLAPYARYGCNRMGMYLSVTQPTQATNQPILFTPQIESALITDKINWTTVSGTYVALGGETWISIGVHYNNASLTIFDFGSSLSGCALANAAAYYLVDNIWVAPNGVGSPPLCAPNSTNCTPLPIELTKFEAVYDGKLVKLSWTTASELNNDYFTVERSVDGENFETVKKIDGAGKSTHEINYKSSDENPLNGISYYRLKQTDFSGAFKYSDIVAVNSPNEITKLSILPNPAQNYIDISFYSEKSTKLILNIYNLLGEIVFKNEFNSEPGLNTQKNNIENLNKGLYFVKLKGLESEQTLKFIKE